MKPVGTAFPVVSALWVAAFHAHWRQPWSVLRRVGEVLVIALLLAYMARLVDVPRNLERFGTSYLAWALVGYALLQLFEGGIRSLPGAVREACQQGWMEGLRMGGASWGQLCLGLASYGWSQAAARALLLLFFGWWASGWAGSWVQTLWAFLLLLPSLVVFGACGWLVAALSIGLGRSESVSRLIVVASLLLCGVFFPRELLVPPAAFVGAWLPLGPALDGIRGSLLQGLAPWEQPDVLVRQGVQLLLLPLGVFAMRRAFRRAQRLPLLGSRWHG